MKQIDVNRTPNTSLWSDVPTKRKHNSTKLLVKKFTMGEITLEDIKTLQVFHEKHCDIRNGGFCDCHPEVLTYSE